MIKKNILSFSLILKTTIFFLYFLVSFNIYGQTASDIETLQTRLFGDYLKGSSTSSASFLSSQLADGSWSDVDYADQGATTWKPSTHLDRLLKMSVAYNKTGDANYHSIAMFNGISNGITYWVNAKPTSTNSWQNGQGKQLYIGKFLILMRDYLSASIRTSISPELNDISQITGETGQNLIWKSVSTVQRGIIEKNSNWVRIGMDSIKGQLKVFSAEGIQADNSFHQHGAQLYSGGYGRVFIGDVSYWVYLTRDLGFGFSTEAKQLLGKLYLDGSRWMIRGSMFDYGAQGREISRSSTSTAASSLISSGDYIKQILPDRASECEALKMHIQGTGPDPLSGNKHFWRSDFMAHHRAGYYTSVKMCSNRTKGTEFGNGENSKGSWLPFGLTYIARTGKEYDNIFPTWDWTGLPGVTSPNVTFPLTTWGMVNQSTTFVGGASDGTYGAAAMDFDKLSTKAKKAYFYFDKEFVCLGTAISSTNSNPIFTTINQCLKSGDMAVNGTAYTSEAQTFTSNKVRVHHDNIGYLLLNNGSGTVSLASRSGSWYDINTSQSSTSITKDVFTMRIAHGTQPSNGSYAYAVVPGITRSNFETYAATPPVSIVSNTSSIQAVYNAQLGVYQAVFYAAGTVNFGTALTIDVDKPCIVVARNMGSSTKLTVSNPLATAITVKCGLKVGSASRVETSFDLPGGQLGGESVSKDVNFTTSLSVPNLNNNNSFSVFPSPTNGSIYMSYNSPMAEKFSIELFNLSGTKMEENTALLGNGIEFPMNLTQYSAGVYFVSMRGAGVQNLQKIIKTD